MRQPDRVGGAQPRRTMELDRDIDVGADGIAQARDLVDRAADIARLDGPVAVRDRRLRRLGRAGMNIDGNAIAEAPAKQTPHRHLQRLSIEVPQRHIDGGERAGAGCAGHAVAHLRDEQLVPQLIDMPRILADQQRREVGECGID